MKIAIASDHAGFALKQTIKQHFGDRFVWLDLGTDSEDSVDYPDFGAALARAIAEGRAERGIAICGSGIGISIAANRHASVRAALCTGSEMAKLARQHNDANILALGARLINTDTAIACVETFMTTAFEGGRHQARVDKLKTVL